MLSLVLSSVFLWAVPGLLFRSQQCKQLTTCHGLGFTMEQQVVDLEIANFWGFFCKSPSSPPKKGETLQKSMVLNRCFIKETQKFKSSKKLKCEWINLHIHSLKQTSKSTWKKTVYCLTITQFLVETLGLCVKFSHFSWEAQVPHTKSPPRLRTHNEFHSDVEKVVILMRFFPRQNRLLWVRNLES